MRDQFSITIFDHSNYSRRHFTLSGSVLFSICLAAVIGIVLTGYLFFQARTLGQAVSETPALNHRIANHRQQITVREQQISFLKEKLDKLGSRFDRLETIEKKIRDIARIEKTINHDNLFGIGGIRNKPADPDESVSPVSDDADITLDNIFNQQHDRNHLRQLSNQPAGFTLVFEPTDLSIKPITGIPSLLPANNIETDFREYPAAVGIMECRRGITVSTREDSYIAAPSNGIAVYAGEDNTSKKILVIDHGHGFITRYTGFDRISIRTGELVRRGDRIGFIKAAPETEKLNHFYYEILLNGLSVNPDKYLSRGPFLL